MSSIYLKIVLTCLILILNDTQCGANSEKVRYIPKPEIPLECHDKEYCEHVPNYPKKYAASLIAKLHERGAIDLFRIRKFISITENNSSSPLCPYTSNVVTPQAAKDSDGEWHFILNQETYPLQQFLAIECRQQTISHRAAMNCGDNYVFMDGATPTCQQKKTTITLTTFYYDRTVTSKPFSLPCCCSCEAATD